jgi:hypothetical protein
MADEEHTGEKKEQLRCMEDAGRRTGFELDRIGSIPPERSSETHRESTPASRSSNVHVKDRGAPIVE